MSLPFSDGKVLIGAVHLQPLPGSPRWTGTASGIVSFWSALSTQEKKALEDDCEAQQ